MRVFCDTWSVSLLSRSSKVFRYTAKCGNDLSEWNLRVTCVLQARNSNWISFDGKRINHKHSRVLVKRARRQWIKKYFIGRAKRLSLSAEGQSNLSDLQCSGRRVVTELEQDRITEESHGKREKITAIFYTCIAFSHNAKCPYEIEM